MKRVVLAAVNSRYVHTNPAVRLLRAMAPAYTQVVEGTMQDPPLRLIHAILDCRPDAVGFSGYIWNRGRMLELAGALRRLRPSLVLFLGGPEFSFEDESFLTAHPEIDFILPGEGELIYRQWLLHWEQTGSPLGAPGTLCRNIPFIHGPVIDLKELPFAYEGELASMQNRPVYYETSRGCPGRCAFCLSGQSQTVRFMPLPKVRQELEALFAAGVSQIKLVDRTFNCHPERAAAILDMVLELDSQYGRHGATNLHMEVRGDLLSEAFLSRLGKAPPGLFQLEIGVQSTNPPTRAAIHRQDDLSRLAANVRRIREMGNTHLHLDLIAGLPYEDMAAFERSFNELWSYEPHMLQLGFLKLLKGSELARRAGEYGLAACDFPPYEILSTPWMSFDELSFLKDIEAVLEWTYNAHAARSTLKAAADMLGQGAFALFCRLARAFRSLGLMDRPLSLENRYEGLYRALDAMPELASLPVEGLLRHDWICHGKPNRYPRCLRPKPAPDAHAIMERALDADGFLAPLAHLSGAHRARLYHVEAYDPPIILQGRSARQVLYRYADKGHGPEQCQYQVLA